MGGNRSQDSFADGRGRMGSDDGASGQRQPKGVLRGIQETARILRRPYGRGNGHGGKALDAQGRRRAQSPPAASGLYRGPGEITRLDQRNVASFGSSPPRSWSHGWFLDGAIFVERPAFQVVAGRAGNRPDP